MFPAFTAFIVKLKQSSYTALDAPCLYKIDEAKNLFLMLVFCSYMGEVGAKTSRGNLWKYRKSILNMFS